MSSVSDLKENNIETIRHSFVHHDVCTKKQLTAETGISAAGVTNFLQDMAGRKEILFSGEADSTGGRRSKQYVLNRDYMHFGCVIMRRTDRGYLFLYGRMDLGGRMISENRFSSTLGTEEELIGILRQMKDEDPLLYRWIIALPGVERSGKVDTCDFHDLEGKDLSRDILQATGIAPILENDVNIAAVGLSSRYPRYHDLAVIFQPAAEYIGVGMVLRDRLYNGFSHFAGELHYLPGMSEEEREKDPEGLLQDQILTLCAVINPAVIGWCSDAFTGKIELPDNVLPEAAVPKLIHIQLDEMILAGMHAMAAEAYCHSPF